MRQLTQKHIAPEDREPTLRIWRRGLYLSPPQVKFSGQRSEERGLLTAVSVFWSRLLRRG